MKYWKALKIDVSTAPIIEGSSHPDGGSKYGEWYTEDCNETFEDFTLTGLLRQIEKRFNMKEGGRDSWSKFESSRNFFREDVIYKNGSPYVREINISKITYKDRPIKTNL